MNPYILAISVFLLTVVLHYPVSRMILSFNVRRLERRFRHRLTSVEVAGEERRARFIALLLVLPFSLLFNLQLLGTLHD